MRTTKEDKLALLEKSLGLSTEKASEGGSPAVCALLLREWELQFRFVVLFKGLVALVAIIVFSVLAISAWWLINGENIDALISGIGAIVSGVAAKFLLNLRSDAQESLDAVKDALAKYKCQMPRE